MVDVKLTGLTANSAHGFLAALGTLAGVRSEYPAARLHWSADFLPHAILSDIDPDMLIGTLLTDRDKRLAGPVLNHPPDKPFETLKCSESELKVWATRIGELPDDDPDIDLWSALVVEGGFDNNNRAKPTHFDFSAGQVKFLKAVREIARALDVDSLTEALYGPWMYQSTLSTLRFEKEGERLQALRAIPPDVDPKTGVPGADWLAFRGLAFYPMSLKRTRGRARVVIPACDASTKKGNFRWPVWAEPLTYDTVAALVTDGRLVGEDTARREHGTDALDAWRIRSVWESAMVRTGKGYGSFGPAKQIARGTLR